jgi:hypothetical protein
MCGKAVPFRKLVLRIGEAAPHATSLRHSLKTGIETVSERQGLSAHQAAEPQGPDTAQLENVRFVYGFH